MIKRGILNADLRSLTARIGHRDRFAIVDAGYNIPLGIETVDLAFLPNIPSMVQVVEGILNEMAIEEVILACEIKEMAPDLDKEYAKHWPEKAKLSYIPHIEFDEEIKKFQPSLEVDDAEEAIYNNDVPDITDLIAKIMEDISK